MYKFLLKFSAKLLLFPMTVCSNFEDNLMELIFLFINFLWIYHLSNYYTYRLYISINIIWCLEKNNLTKNSLPFQFTQKVWKLSLKKSLKHNEELICFRFCFMTAKKIIKNRLSFIVSSQPMNSRNLECFFQRRNFKSKYFAIDPNDHWSYFLILKKCKEDAQWVCPWNMIIG